MTDIVERLCDGTYCTVGCAKLRGDAAAEIERLRDLLAFYGIDPNDRDERAKGAYRRALEPKP